MTATPFFFNNNTAALPAKLRPLAAVLHACLDASKSFPIIHIAGTNGKGSTAAFLERILRAANYRTGLFTSPHLVRYHERIRVDGMEIPDDTLCALRAEIAQCAADLGVTLHYFQEATAIALAYFQQRQCDVVLLECGLGGRLDPTNLISVPALTLITRIGLDHQAYLGDSIEEIATEKAGIIKPNADVLTVVQDAVVEKILQDTCRSRGARLQVVPPLPLKASPAYTLHCAYGDIPLGISGTFQAENAALALSAAETLHARGGFSISPDAIREGLRLACWPSRFERIANDPPLLLDGAHNPQGVQALMDCIHASFPDHKRVFIIGCMQDKNYRESIALAAPHAHAMIAVAPNSPRALPTEELASTMRTYHKQVYAAESMEDALCIAQGVDISQKAIFVFGSLYLAADLYEAAR